MDRLTPTNLDLFASESRRARRFEAPSRQFSYPAPETSDFFLTFARLGRYAPHRVQDAFLLKMLPRAEHFLPAQAILPRPSFLPTLGGTGDDWPSTSQRLSPPGSGPSVLWFPPGVPQRCTITLGALGAASLILLDFLDFSLESPAWRPTGV
jgi:hypothetical protein